MTSNHHNIDVICFGESMVLFSANEAGDLAHASTFTRRLCGADSNVAIGLTRMGHRVHWLSRVGNDAFGRYICDTLQSEGLSISHIEIDDARPTAVMFKARSKDGSDPATLYYRAASAASALSPKSLTAETIRSTRHIHITGISAALSDDTLALCHHAIDSAHQHGATVSFDPNIRPALWPNRNQCRKTLNTIAKKCDWLLIGLSEATELTGTDNVKAISDFYLKHHSSEIVIKNGAQGSMLFDGKNKHLAPPVSVDHIIDTVGAGDAFATGYISARLNNKTPHEALIQGNAFGANAVRHAGDYEALPTRQSVHTLHGINSPK